MSRSIVGGKAGSGLDRWIVNQLPPHRTYVEAFLGHGAVCRLKRPAMATIVIDVDPEMIQQAAAWSWPGVTAICGDAVQELPRLPLDDQTLVYLDPPYLFTTRACTDRSYYRHEFGTEAQHTALLQLVTTLPSMVAISGYRSRLYDSALTSWRRVERQAVNRAGQCTTECLWLNYPEPEQLHDARFAGDGFRAREVISRRRHRWVSRYVRMAAADRSSILAGLLEAENALTGSRQLWQMVENLRDQAATTKGENR